MTLEIGLLFGLLGVMVWLFLTERLPIDLTAFAGLVALVFLGYVTPDEAFQGFASPAVITMLSIFIVSGALMRTGVADYAGQWAHTMLGNRETVLIAAIMVIAGVLSAFMNNIAATAVLMPAVAAIARRARLSPSALFMPLSFGAILGGTTTLVGTPPNILSGELLRDRGLEPFGLFAFTPPGAVLLAVGVVYMVTVGRRLLPRREWTGGDQEGTRLARRFGLVSGTISIRVGAGSPLADRTLGETRLGTALGLQVVAIERDGRTLPAPAADTVLRAGDLLDVEGAPDELRRVAQMRNLDVRPIRAGELPRPTRGVSGLAAVVAERSPHRGRTLRELRFRERFGVVVVGVVREGLLLREIGELGLRAGDRILALGRRDRLLAFEGRPEFERVEIGLSALREIEDRLFLIHVPPGSALAGQTVEGSRFGELAGVTVAAVVRDGETRLGAAPEETIRPDDRLLVVGEPSRVTRLLEIGELDLVERGGADVLESEDVGVVEAALSPRSRIAGRTPADIAFRERYGLQVLAIEREGRAIRRDLAHVSLRLGDALLLQGPLESIELLAGDEDFVVLSRVARAPRRTGRAPVALGALALMVVLVVGGWQPIHVASFTAATLVVLGGAIRMEEAYRAIEWRVIFLVAAILPVGVAMERTGAAQLLADGVIGSIGPLGSLAVLGALVVLSSLFSQGLDGAPAVVLLAPVGLEAAAQLGLNPHAVMMGIALAASAAFMTPFSHKANLLVMGAGGYRTVDYLKVGTPLTVILLALMILLVPVFFPL